MERFSGSRSVSYAFWTSWKLCAAWGSSLFASGWYFFASLKTEKKSQLLPPLCCPLQTPETLSLSLLLSPSLGPLPSCLALAFLLLPTSMLALTRSKPSLSRHRWRREEFQEFHSSHVLEPTRLQFPEASETGIPGVVGKCQTTRIALWGGESGMTCDLCN